jgi:intracellular septation protein
MGTAWSMDDQGWRKLTFRFALFFLAMAGLNEAVWRTQSTDFWVSFKVFGILGLTLLFALAQTPLMRRHHLATEEAGGEGSANPGED